MTRGRDYRRKNENVPSVPAGVSLHALNELPPFQVISLLGDQIAGVSSLNCRGP